MIDDRARLIAAFAFTDLVAAWLWFSFRAARQQLVAPEESERPARPRIGLHDDPARVLAEAQRRAPADRRGTPPPLR
jgi:hypothetical protein